MMGGIGIIGAIIIGGLAGWVAERVMQSNMGLISNIILGIVGALVLNAILRFLNIVPPDSWIGQFIVAAIGAIILIWVWRAIRGNRPAM